MIGKETDIESIRSGDGDLKLEPEEWIEIYKTKRWAWFIGYITSHINQMISDQCDRAFIKRYSER